MVRLQTDAACVVAEVCGAQMQRQLAYISSSYRRRSSIAEWADAAFEHVSRRLSAKVFQEAAVELWARKAQSFADVALWEASQASQVQHVERLLASAIREPEMQLNCLRTAIHALTLQGQAEEGIAESFDQCHALLLPLGGRHAHSIDESVSQSSLSVDDEPQIPPASSFADVAIEATAHLSARSLSARGRAHGLSHAAASLRCEEKALKDETSAVGSVLNLKEEQVHRLLERVHNALLDLSAAYERQRVLVGYVIRCPLNDDLWLLTRRMSHFAAAYVMETQNLAPMAAELSSRLCAASERAGRNLRCALHCVSGECSNRNLEKCSTMPAVGDQATGRYIWAKPEVCTGIETLPVPALTLPTASPMPSPSAFAIKSGSILRLRPGNFARADEWIDEWAVLTVDGFLHLFACAHCQVVPLVSLACSLRPRRLLRW